MSDVENDQSNRRESQLYQKKWIVNYAANGLSICKDLHCLCGDKRIPKGSLRVGRRYPSPFDPDSIAINWFHAKCMFHQQSRSRVGTQIIGSLNDVDGVDNILLADRDYLDELIQGNIELTVEAPSSTVQASTPGEKVTVKAGIKKKKATPTTNGKRVSINRRDAGRVLLL